MEAIVDWYFFYKFISFAEVSWTKLDELKDKPPKDCQTRLEHQLIPLWLVKVFENCSTNNRSAKKKTYWPLEILEFAEKLEEITISRKKWKRK